MTLYLTRKGRQGEAHQTTAVVKKTLSGILSPGVVLKIRLQTIDRAIVTGDPMERPTAGGFSTALVIATALSSACAADAMSIELTGTTDTDEVAEGPPGPTDVDALRPNEPAGMTQIYYNDGTVADISTEGWLTNQSGGDLWDERVTSIEESSNPTGSGWVLQMFHPGTTEHQGAGRGSLTEWSNLNSSTIGHVEDLYVTTWIHKLGDHPHGHKLWYIGLEPDAHSPSKTKTNDWYHTWQNNGGSKVTLQGLSQGNQNVWIDPEPYVGLENDWVQVEMHYVASSAVGMSDGIVRVWINGELVVEKTDWETWDADGATSRLIAGMEWYHNVSNETEPEGGHIYWVGGLYVSGKEPS